MRKLTAEFATSGNSRLGALSARRRLSACAFVLAFLCCAKLRADEGLLSPQYATLRVGFTTEEFSATGWWLDAGLQRHWPLSSLWYVTGEVALAITRDATTRTLPYRSSPTYQGSQYEQTSHNRRLLLGVPARAGIGFGGDLLGFELGVVVGAAWSSTSSDVCPNRSGLAPMLGAYAGPVVHLGSRRSVRIAAQIQSVSPIMPRCVNTGQPQFQYGYAPEWFADTPPDPAFVTQLGVS
ncbi:MAG: hypothetical protein ACM3ZE_25930 [Myxococcales bacterium]